MSERMKKARYMRLKKRAKYSSRVFNQCSICGRRRAYIRQFGICRICLRKLAHEGLLPGVVKSSW